MARKYLIPATLTALLLGCGKSDNQNFETRTQTYQDKALETARKSIQSEDYRAAINLLQGYAVSDQKVLAERNFLLGEATLKSISKSDLMALCAQGNTRLNAEYAQAIKEFRKNYETSQSYFKTAIDLNNDLEKRLDNIYLVHNRKLGNTNKNDPKCITLLKRLVYSVDKGDENEIKSIINFGFDREELTRLKTKEIVEEFARKKATLENIKNRGAKLPRPIVAGLERKDPEGYEREKARWKEELEINERLHELEIESEINPKIDALKAECDRKMNSLKDTSLKDLIKPQLESRGYDIEWLNNNDIVILVSNDEMAELLIVENSGRPELKLKKIKVSNTVSGNVVGLDPFIGK